MKEILVPASKHDIDGVAYWLVDRFFNDSFQVLPDREARESRGQTHDELYRDGERSLSMLMAAKTLLNSPNTYSINLWSSSEAVEQRLVRQLVRLDRLPRNNPLSGLRLLSDAWRSMVKVPPLGSAPARPLCLISARLAALGSSVLPERGPASGTPTTASGAQASCLRSRRFHCLAPCTTALDCAGAVPVDE